MRRRREAIRRLASLLEYLSIPQLVSLRTKGVPRGHYLELAQPWLARRPIRSVLDVGANTGQFALAAHAVFPDAVIHSFEPLPDCFSALSRRLARVPGARAHAMALGESTGTVTMHRSRYSPSSSLLPMTHTHEDAFPKTRGVVDVSVPIARLDDVASTLDLPHELLLKIDVQGFEDRVLKGAGSVLGQASVVVVETSFEELYEGQASHEVVADLLREAGFRYHGALGQLLDPRDGRVLSADSVFLRTQATQPAK